MLHSLRLSHSPFYGLSGGTAEEPGTLALSSAVGTGEIALPKVGSSAGKPAKQQELAIRRDVLNPLLDAVLESLLNTPSLLSLAEQAQTSPRVDTDEIE